VIERRIDADIGSDEEHEHERTRYREGRSEHAEERVLGAAHLLGDLAAKIPSDRHCVGARSRLADDARGCCFQRVGAGRIGDDDGRKCGIIRSWSLHCRCPQSVAALLVEQDSEHAVGAVSEPGVDLVQRFGEPILKLF